MTDPLDADTLPDGRYEHALYLQNLMISRATGQAADDGEYRALRREFMEDPRTRDLLPRYVRTCRDLSSFWGTAKAMSDTWAGRRAQIAEDFSPLLDNLELLSVPPSDAETSDAITAFDAEGVQIAWQRALDRRGSDPEGAITAARALLETVCKHVLDASGVAYGPSDDLPKLYRAAAEQINIAPSQHSEDAFRRVLGGCASVVEGLGSLRNRVGDAHGQGRRAVRPAPRHARLAVNLAGAVAAFMVETWLWRAEQAND